MSEALSETASGAAAPRNIVVCCDGTSNEFGTRITNVVRLVQVLVNDPKTQKIHYVPGVGTMPGPGLATRVGQKISLLSGLAFGTGLNGIVESAYTYLMNTVEPGDRIYLFGFSRGAYSARVLAAMLHAMGLLPRGNENMVPYAMRLFRSVRSNRSLFHTEQKNPYWDLLNSFRSTFARTSDSTEIPDPKRCRVEYVGVWDTVSSVGWVWEPVSFPYTRTNPSIGKIRHALAIDERRWFFRQNEFKAAPGQDCKQLWFAGSHGDVGGGYKESEGLWLNSFKWMVDEAKAAGLLVDEDRYKSIWSVLGDRDSALEHQNESLTAAWWPAEFVPKWSWRGADSRRLTIGKGGRRTLPPDAVLHDSVLRRLKGMKPPYAPPNIPPGCIPPAG
jgi:uncharacterized protein (DUF2235 family)